MKKIVLTALLLCVLLAGCGAKTVNVLIDHGSSALFTDAEIDEAAKVVKAKFNTFENGCRLYSLTYAGDETAERELEYYNIRSENGTVYADCLVFNSIFRSPRHASGGWNSNEIYTWTWTLARTEGGNWELINYGYA